MEQRRTKARALADKGRASFDSGQWQIAYDQFHEANEIFHAPPLALYMALSLSELGKLLEARDLYRQILAEPLPKGAPAPFVAAHERARVQLDTLRPRIPSVRVTITGVSYNIANVLLDGSALPEEGREVNPGTHTIEAMPVEGERTVKTVTLAEGDVLKVNLALSRREPVLVPAPKADPVTPSSTGASKGIVIGGAALSAVALGVGIGLTGWWAHLESNQFCIKQAPDPGQCMQTWASVKTASVWTLVGAGVVGAGTLTYGLVMPRLPQPLRASVSIGPVGASTALSLEW
ncbi:MAG: hypothetical protein QM820_20445 [Minicystis sp.]